MCANGVHVKSQCAKLRARVRARGRYLVHVEVPLDVGGVRVWAIVLLVVEGVGEAETSLLRVTGIKLLEQCNAFVIHFPRIHLLQLCYWLPLLLHTEAHTVIALTNARITVQNNTPA